mgnify:CR=1 FL=1
MKKLTVAISAVAASVLMAMSAQAAEIYNKDSNKLDLYGKVNAKHYFSSNDADDGDTTYARLGFKGETQINDQLTGFGQWEYEFKGNRAESQGSSKDKTRLAFAGLKFGDYGSIDYGRNYGVAYDIGAWTDVLPEFGGDTWTQTDVFMTGRTTGVATYRNNDFFGLVDGLNFAVQYLGKNERDTARRSNGDGVGGSISYEYEGFGIVGAYGAADRTNLQEAQPLGNGKKAEQWATGLKYDANNIYLAANYGETRNATPITNKFTNTSGFANKTQDVLLVAQYQFDFGLRPSIAYTKSKAKDVEDIGDVDLVNYFEVGATYYFNKNMSTYVDYIINQIDSDNKLGVGSDDTVAVGIVYQF